MEAGRRTLLSGGVISSAGPLQLRWCTPAEWEQRAGALEVELLSDHAHCELRAAASAQALITRNPERAPLVEQLTATAIEELRHFRRVVRCLGEIGGELRSAGPNPYVEALTRRSAESRGTVLLDRLLVSALIEARSLERFEILAESAATPRVRELYSRLVPSERAHAELFVGLAEEAFGAPRVAERLERLLVLEAEVASGLEFAARVHSGPIL